jgi:hypothetical protein
MFWMSMSMAKGPMVTQQQSDAVRLQQLQRRHTQIRDLRVQYVFTLCSPHSHAELVTGY